MAPTTSNAASRCARARGRGRAPRAAHGRRPARHLDPHGGRCAPRLLHRRSRSCAARGARFVRSSRPARSSARGRSACAASPPVRGRRSPRRTVIVAAGAWARGIGSAPASRSRLRPTRRHMLGPPTPATLAPQRPPVVWDDAAGLVRAPEGRGWSLDVRRERRVRRGRRPIAVDDAARGAHPHRADALRARARGRAARTTRGRLPGPHAGRPARAGVGTRELPGTLVVRRQDGGHGMTLLDRRLDPRARRRRARRLGGCEPGARRLQSARVRTRAPLGDRSGVRIASMLGAALIASPLARPADPAPRSPDDAGRAPVRGLGPADARRALHRAATAATIRRPAKRLDSVEALAPASTASRTSRRATPTRAQAPRPSGYDEVFLADAAVRQDLPETDIAALERWVAARRDDSRPRSPSTTPTASLVLPPPVCAASN